MTDFNDHQDFGERGSIEQKIAIKREQLQEAQQNGDPLTAHNIRHTISELERELENETRQPIRVTA